MTGISSTAQSHLDENPTKFVWTNERDCHILRRKQIVEKYPQILELIGYDIWEALYCVVCIIIQCLINYYIYCSNISWPALIVLTYIVSGTINHTFFFAMHELCHGLMFPKLWMNQFLGIIVNIIMGIPAASSFNKYHTDHHVYFGVASKDPDLPTDFEAIYFKNRILKFIWLAMMPISYTLRPLILMPKKIIKYDVVNASVVITTNILLFVYGGPKCLFYFVMGSVLGMSIHPLAGHFIAEHYHLANSKVQETYSYYGICNLFCYNVGYHVEHHDFPKIAGSRLPKVKAIAKEFYDTLDSHQSWTKTLYDFIMSNSTNVFCRIKRIKKEL